MDEEDGEQKDEQTHNETEPNTAPQENQEIEAEKPPVVQSAPIGTPKKKKGPRLIINIFNTQYPIIEQAAKNLNFRSKQVDPNLYINPYL
jgi:hypothetical protein